MELKKAEKMFYDSMDKVIKLGYKGLLDSEFGKKLKEELSSHHREVAEMIIIYNFSCLKEWTFGYNRSKTSHGYCYYGKRMITLSKHLTLLNDEKEVMNTILHEIAHAILPSTFHHNKIWKSLFIYLGGDGNVLASKDAKELVGKYVYYCVKCGAEYHLFRKSNKLRSCSHCCKTFNRDYILQLKSENNLVIK